MRYLVTCVCFFGLVLLAYGDVMSVLVDMCMYRETARDCSTWAYEKMLIHDVLNIYSIVFNIRKIFM